MKTIFLTLFLVTVIGTTIQAQDSVKTKNDSVTKIDTNSVLHLSKDSLTGTYLTTPVISLHGSGIQYLRYSTDYNNPLDTVKVFAYCLNKHTLKTTWRRLYGIRGFTYPETDLNGLKLYLMYLMPDRKTHSIYKVIYAIDR